MKESISIRHLENMSFSVKVSGHEMKIDSAKEFGGKDQGPRPKSLMLVALAGCTGMDVVSILGKMRVAYEEFSIEVDGNITDEHPKHYDHMHIKYIIKGKNIPADKVNNAINLSQDKYCGVSHSYRQVMKITHELVILE